MDFIDELETVYQDANDEIVQQMVIVESAGNKQGHGHTASNSQNKQLLLY
jgi:hypothetical protein